ncbi:4-hydroxyacetophenone monooxygenase [Albimonas donghaensis]|uniref:4-hydroxyacetophenone monooxygenase n=1 Tax=Albimonas donghaensis TaxID=356660 RepID=A0A1H2QUI5_9RHOB|nr:NAD(P)/FAD-dependent oxidoreductase [Albimonas donghaensis]SDW10540.1 4-hydroxyacetophenone monooxygenase [Albimonas donghaensis]
MTDAASADRARFAAAVADANIPVLLMLLVQMTGDLRWMQAPYRPRRAIGLDDNDDGGLPPGIQSEIRDAALDAILTWRAGRPLAIAEPDPALLEEMLACAMAERPPEGYGEIIAEGLGLARHSLSEPVPAPEGFRVIVIGGGASGICAAIRLRERGIATTLIEKNDDYGGTWLENRYPAAGVDTPNAIYAYSFAPHDWTRPFALRDEIHGYLSGVARDFRLPEITRFGTTVTRADWDEGARIWRVEAEGPDGREVLEAEAVISCVGVLNIPKTPTIPGLDSFPGPAFHTARWPEGLDVTGKRVAVVGNGASAMQVVPAIAERTEHLTVYARSPQWAAPFPQFGREIPEGVRMLLREVPLYRAWHRQRMTWTFNDRVHGSLQKDPDWPHPDRALNASNDAHRRHFEDYVRAELGERQDLAPLVIPTYPPFGKRMLMDNGWFRTMARPDVTLVADRLAEVDGAELVAGDGARREADVLVLAIGFVTARMLGNYQVTGRGGRLLSEVWDDDDPRAYLGTTVPGFPNFFMLLGPNVGLGHGGSIIANVEMQTDYVLALLDALFARRAEAIEVREDVHDAYNARVDAAHEKMVWTHPGMTNWYRNDRGRVVALTPWRNDDFWRMTRKADPDDYVFDRAPAEAAR